jgi:drug/metabolite transporter (DMT)-like permease
LLFSFIILNDRITIMQLMSTILVIFGLYYVNKDEINYLKNQSHF